MIERPSSTGDLARIERIEDRTAIADLVHLYARHVRYRRAAECAALFCEDGIFEVRDGMPGEAEASTRERMVGRDQIRAHMTQQDLDSRQVCPMIHNLIIEVDGSHARSNCVMRAQLLGTDHAIIGEYHDEYRRDGGWLFASRIFTIFSAAPIAPE